LGLTIVEDRGAADLLIEVDRVVFTNVHTFVLSDKKTSIVLAQVKVPAFNGIIASDPMAKRSSISFPLHGWPRQSGRDCRDRIACHGSKSFSSYSYSSHLPIVCDEDSSDTV